MKGTSNIYSLSRHNWCESTPHCLEKNALRRFKRLFRSRLLQFFTRIRFIPTAVSLRASLVHFFHQSQSQLPELRISSSLQSCSICLQNKTDRAAQICSAWRPLQKKTSLQASEKWSLEDWGFFLLDATLGWLGISVWTTSGLEPRPLAQVLQSLPRSINGMGWGWPGKIEVVKGRIPVTYYTKANIMNINRYRYVF